MGCICTVEAATVACGACRITCGAVPGYCPCGVGALCVANSKACCGITYFCGVAGVAWASIGICSGVVGAEAKSAVVAPCFEVVVCSWVKSCLCITSACVVVDEECSRITTAAWCAAFLSHNIGMGGISGLAPRQL